MMAVFIAAAVGIYSFFIVFSIFAAVQQIKSENLTYLRKRCPPKKFSHFLHLQTKIVLVTVAKSLSLCVFALAVLLTELPETLWSFNQAVSKSLSCYGIYDNDYEVVWTVMLPILTLYLFYEIHSYLFQWILKPDSREKYTPPLSLVNRISVCIIGLHFITTCIILEDISKIFSLFTALSFGRLLLPFFKYSYILWAYPVQPMTDPWLCRETSDIAKRNKMTVKRILVVKYPCMECKGVRCWFGNLLVDSRLLQWQSDFTCDLRNITNLNGNYLPTTSQNEVRAMITHTLGRWVNYNDLKMSLIFICQLAGITVALTLSTFLSSELGQTFPINIEIALNNEAKISAILQEQRLRAPCMGALGVLLCIIVPIIYSSHLIQNIYRQRVNIEADSFTLVNFQGKQLCRLLEIKGPPNINNFSSRHWAYQILYPKWEAMIVERIAILKNKLKKIMYF